MTTPSTAAAGVGSSGQKKPYPWGVYCLLNGNTPPDPTVLGYDYIKGHRIRTGWEDVQPDLGEFQFDAISQMVSDAESHKQRIGLGVSAGVSAPAKLWEQPGVTKFTLPAQDVSIEKQEPHMALPWEEAYHDYWFPVIDALGHVFDRNQVVSYVVVSGIMQLFENRFVGSEEGEAQVQQLARKAGYSDFSTAWMEGAEAIVAAYAKAFPSTVLILTMARVIPSDPKLGDRLAEWAKGQYPGRFGTMTAYLKATPPPHEPNTQPAMTYPKGDQPIYASGDQERFYGENPPVPYPKPPQLADDICAAAIAKNDMWLEMYLADCKEPANADVIKARNLEFKAIADKAQGKA